MTTAIEEKSNLSIHSVSNVAATAWTERQLNPARANAIETYAGDSILDVGCGNGRYVLHYADKYTTTGIDIQTYPQWDAAPELFHVGDASTLPFDDNEFDTVCCFETLEHVPQPEKVISELHRVCRKNVIITVPNCSLPPALTDSNLTFFHYTDRSHVNFFTEQKLSDALVSAGFLVEDTQAVNACRLSPLINFVLPLPYPFSLITNKLASRKQLFMTVMAIANKC